MTKQELEAFAKEAAKDLKSHQDLLDFSQMFTKIEVVAKNFASAQNPTFT